MSELEGLCPELMGISSDALTVSSCVTPHGLGMLGQPNRTQTPVQLPTGDTPQMLMNSVDR